jgi:predicted transcriptional regulator
MCGHAIYKKKTGGNMERVIDIDPEITREFRRLMIECDLTYKDVNKLFGISPSMLNRIITRGQKCSDRTKYNIEKTIQKMKKMKLELELV